MTPFLEQGFYKCNKSKLKRRILRFGIYVICFNVLLFSAC